MTFYKNKIIFSWCLYDWANSVLATIIFTFIFPVYFARNIVGDEELGSAYWGYTIGISGLIIAICGPVLGAITDTNGRRKVVLGALTAITILSTFVLFWAKPHTDFILYALIFIGITTVGFELAQAQYNALLSEIVPSEKMGQVSGVAWAMGYLGGLVCLSFALGGFIGLGDENSGFLNISQENNYNIRATSILSALWYGVFALPLFLFFPKFSCKKYSGSLIKTSLKNLTKTLKSLGHQSRNTLRFLIASAIYRDGLNTLFAVGGLYAAGTFDMEFHDILIFAIGINVTSAIGAFVFGFIEDAYGAKSVIIGSLIALVFLGICIVFVQSKDVFMMISLALGIFIGPVQSSSRSIMARLTPFEKSSELFGLYAMSGKSIAFTGPLIFAFVTHITDSQRWGIATIIIMWVIGLAVFRKVKL